ncbi:MAG: hypothetical protein JST09_20380 [Bacteroidetes bacterium]|nr:hypothetical protein [Bacteroidota bacterium]
MLETYSYDTVNRKLTINITGSGAAALDVYPSGTKEEITYNADKLVSHVDITYPSGAAPDPYYYSSADMEYDADKIIKKLTTTTLDGAVQETVFTKQLLSSGFQLTWSYDDAGMTVQRKAVFNITGNNTVNNFTYPDGSFITDSLIYDGNGNITKVFTKNADSTYVHYDFKTRQQQGDQLYKQRQLIMNGIANIPFTDNDYNGTIELFGLLSLDISNESWQYVRFPYQSVIAFNSYSNSYIDLSPSFEVDSKNRLTKFRLYEEDILYTPFDFQISYYK